MDERGLVGLEARTPGGEEIGRISEVVEDEDGAVTHVVVEQEGQRLEVPITAISLDRDVDFATFHADRSDDEPGDHVGDEEAPQGYAPSESDVDDSGHEGQFVTAPTDPNEAASSTSRFPRKPTRRAAGRTRAAPPWTPATLAPTPTSTLTRARKRLIPR